MLNGNSIRLLLISKTALPDQIRGVRIKRRLGRLERQRLTCLASGHQGPQNMVELVCYESSEVKVCVYLYEVVNCCAAVFPIPAYERALPCSVVSILPHLLSSLCY